jgi:hypothetical protein
MRHPGQSEESRWWPLERFEGLQSLAFGVSSGMRIPAYRSIVASGANLALCRRTYGPCLTSRGTGSDESGWLGGRRRAYRLPGTLRLAYTRGRPTHANSR